MRNKNNSLIWSLFLSTAFLVAVIGWPEEAKHLLQTVMDWVEMARTRWKW